MKRDPRTALGVAAAAVVAHLLLPPRFATWLEVAVLAGAVAVIAVRVLEGGPRAVLWRFAGLGAVLSLVPTTTLSAVPSAADDLWLLILTIPPAWICAAVVLAAVIRELRAQGATDVLVDASLPLAALGVVAWAILGPPGSEGDRNLPLLLGVPFLGIAVVVGVVAVTFVVLGLRSTSTTLLLVGFGCGVVGDVAWYVGTMRGSYVVGGPADAAFTAAYLLTLLSAASPDALQPLTRTPSATSATAAGPAGPPAGQGVSAGSADLPWPAPILRRPLFWWACGVVPSATLAWVLASQGDRDGAVIAVLSGVAVGLLVVRAARLLERAQRQAARLHELSVTDALTGVANRRAWDDTVEGIVRRARHADRPVVVALVDVDHFKRYNDDHGHAAGDDLLQAAALAWRGLLRPGDVLARWGGEEFALCLPDCDLDEGVKVLGRVVGALPHGVTASAGAAAVRDADTVTVALARADAALYEAKRTGRARVVSDREDVRRSDRAGPHVR